MDFKSVLDVLLFAVSKERASQKFYLDMASQMEDPTTRSIFRAISKQEEKHIESLNLEIMKAGYTVDTEADRSGGATQYQADECLELNETSRRMNYVDALLLAIQKEKASFQLYAQLVGMTEDLELRKMLLELAEEEMRHVLQFEREYETVTHHKD